MDHLARCISSTFRMKSEALESKNLNLNRLSIYSTMLKVHEG